jgi:phenylalanine-4-hydroxylase
MQPEPSFPSVTDSPAARNAQMAADQAAELPPEKIDPNLFYIPQLYNRYTPNEHSTWRVLAERRLPLLQSEIFSDGWRMIRSLDIPVKRIPNIDDLTIGRECNLGEGLILADGSGYTGLNASLKSTGWTFCPVPGYLPLRSFCACLVNRQLPTSVDLRAPQTLKSHGMPDIFSDITGHAAFIADPALEESLMTLASKILNCRDDETLAKLGRVYWFTFVNGLVTEGGQNKVYGSNLVGNALDSVRALSAGQPGGPELLPFDLERISQTEFQPEVPGSTFFVLDCFERLRDALRGWQ